MRWQVSEYVPTTEEVRADFVFSRTLGSPRKLGEVVAAFDAWLAAHDAEVAAKTLDDAADEYAERLPDGTGNGRAYNAHAVAQNLRARAAEYRKAVES